MEGVQDDAVPPSPTWCDMNLELALLREGKMEEHCGVVPRGFLCCRLCEEEFRQPKFLPCLHSFCKDCLQAHVKKFADEDGYFGCPICGTETTLRQQKVEKLPDNLFARRLSNPAISLPKPPKRDKSRNCRQCGQKSEISFHCINCDDFLCQMCSESHQQQEETASHSTQTIQDYEAQNKPRSRPASPDTPSVLSKCCEYYDAYDIGAMFCVDCDMALCSECHAKSHQEHRCAELTAVSQNFEMKIKPPLDQLTNDSKTLKKTLKDLEIAEKVVEKQQIRLQADVKNRTKVLCNLITEYENVLLSEVDKRQSHNRECINQKRNDIELHLASIQAVTDLTEKLVSFGSEEEKVSLRKKIGRRVRELCETELPTQAVNLVSLNLCEPDVNVEKICDLFGELKTGVASCSRRSSRSHISTTQESGHPSISDSIESHDNDTEITELEDYEERDHDMLSASNTSETFRAIQEEPEEQEQEQSNSSFQSSSQEEVPSLTLDTPAKELALPSNIQRDCIKGMGVNQSGDIIIGAASAGSQCVYYVEKRGIIRGQIPVEKGWNIHSVAPDGKVAVAVTRGDNRYKVKVLSNDGCGTVLANLHLESFGLNYVAPYSQGQVIISSSRYAQLNRNYGKSAKSGGNVAVYNKDGQITLRITNDDFVDEGLYLFEKPQHIAVDNDENFFVCDPSSHIVSGFNKDGVLLFEYGNTDSDGEIYQGPDLVCVDRNKNVLVTDKREGRIDLLTYDGQLQKCFFLEDVVKFVSVSSDNMLVIGTTEGTIKFHEYL
ncbi:tripartite motif-containing protein 2-like isoform X1 [Haliotis cracherodii]|uniref:tripartite motif-containing protein 2-like isoform X1 n=2 Tax=Haliotis cracherodii TaxID=6455 RepID=UPI0039ECE75D